MIYSSLSSLIRYVSWNVFSVKLSANPFRPFTLLPLHRLRAPWLQDLRSATDFTEPKVSASYLLNRSPGPGLISFNQILVFTADLRKIRPS